MAKIRLGDLLVRAGVLDEGKLKAALAQQQRWGGRLGRILVDMSFLSEDLLVKALSKQLGIPRAKFDNAPIPPQVLRAVSADFARAHMLVPERYDPQKKLLVLAMADVSDVKAIDELRFKTGLRIEPTLGGEMAISQEIDRRYETYGSGNLNSEGSSSFSAAMAASGVPLSSDLPPEGTGQRLQMAEPTSRGMPATTPVAMGRGLGVERTSRGLRTIEGTSRGMAAAPRTIPGSQPPDNYEPTSRGLAPVPQTIQGAPQRFEEPLGSPESLGLGFSQTASMDAGPPPSEAARELGARLDRAQRQQNKALRVMVELLIEKGVFSRDEYLDLVSRGGGTR